MTDVVIKEDEKKETIANLRSLKTVQNLWLMLAATSRRWVKSSQCEGAIQEAETLTGESAELWVQYGFYCLSSSKMRQAIDSLTKALAFSDYHVPAVVHMAQILKEQGSVELALKHGKECLLFSLSLDETKPLRPLRLCLPSFL